MSKTRYIDTHFWSDNWIDNLNRDERYFFLYLLTNDKTSIAGVYEIPLKMIAFETGFTKNEVIELFHKLKAKVRYIDGWVVMRNGIKNQAYQNPKIKRGIQIILEQCDVDLHEYINFPKDFDEIVDKSKKGPQQQRLDDSLLRPMDRLSHSNTNSNTNLIPIEPDKPVGTKQVLSKSQKRQYAIAMDAEREQKERANKSRTRTGSGLAKAKAVAEQIKIRKLGEAK